MHKLLDPSRHGVLSFLRHLANLLDQPTHGPQAVRRHVEVAFERIESVYVYSVDESPLIVELFSNTW